MIEARARTSKPRVWRAWHVRLVENQNRDSCRLLASVVMHEDAALPFPPEQISQSVASGIR